MSPGDAVVANISDDCSCVRGGVGCLLTNCLNPSKWQEKLHCQSHPSRSSQAGTPQSTLQTLLVVNHWHHTARVTVLRPSINLSGLWIKEAASHRLLSLQRSAQFTMHLPTEGENLGSYPAGTTVLMPPIATHADLIHPCDRKVLLIRYWPSHNTQTPLEATHMHCKGAVPSPQVANFLPCIRRGERCKAST